ncbi:major intracellular serine protease [Metabacillus crassostreae]|uniref:S8 family peptidase n=1 Tax=Metabacillus crassostreae TaxID=929098 RepID=UPI001957D6DA|nr:S8 family peptidase [Metabacillus crassostreae]MBM7603781.1 major intracellular serine protease [Metabacillus crassostreae]
MSYVHLIPYTVQSIIKSTKEIPPGIQLINAPFSWDHGYKGEGVVIAVLDTGCESNHSELREQIIDGKNFTTDDQGDSTNFEDYNGHGTHVCGTICAARNESGVVGVAPNAKLLVIKVLNEKGYGETKWVIEGIRYAMNWRGPKGEKVRIISMSLGSSEDSIELHKIIQKAINSNILVICAAGNEGDGNHETNEFAYPGAYPEVVQVGSVNLQKQISVFSNTNTEVDLVAPGEEILSTYLNNEFAVLSGTSMATPHISAAAALIIQQCEQEFERFLTESESYAQIIKRTVELDVSRRYQGNGLLDLSIGFKSRYKQDDQLTVLK